MLVSALRSCATQPPRWNIEGHFVPWSNVVDMLHNGGFAGVPERIRTSDLRFRKPDARLLAQRVKANKVVRRSDVFRFDSGESRFVGASCTLGKGLQMAWRYDPERAARAYREIEERHLAEMDAMHPRHGLCYFVGSLEGHVVKIGHTCNLWQRVGAIKAKSGPYRLSLLASASGGSVRERYYHRRFAEHCIGGEWFTLAPEIEAEIERLTNLAPDPRQRTEGLTNHRMEVRRG